jgi:hypothetical protein
MVANGKRSKTRISRLEQEEGIVEGEEQLLNIPRVIIRNSLVTLREIIVQ